MACYKDAADLLADLERFHEAIQLYEQVADHSLQSALTKYSVKEYWLRSSLCALALGVSVRVDNFCIPHPLIFSRTPSRRKGILRAILTKTLRSHQRVKRNLWVS